MRAEPTSTESSLPFQLLSLTGTDAQTFLQNYVTSDVDSCTAEQALPTALVTLQGRVIANGWVFGTSERMNLFVHHSVVERVRSHISKFLLFSKSKLDTVSTDESTNMVRLLPFDLSIGDLEALGADFDNWCIDNRFVPVTDPIAETFLPQMLGLTDVNAVSFTKGCYLGQEVVARAEHRGQVKRQLREYSWRGSALSVGDVALSELKRKNTVVVAGTDRALIVTSDSSDVLQTESAILSVVG